MKDSSENLKQNLSREEEMKDPNESFESTIEDALYPDDAETPEGYQNGTSAATQSSASAAKKPRDSVVSKLLHKRLLRKQMRSSKLNPATDTPEMSFNFQSELESGAVNELNSKQERQRLRALRRSERIEKSATPTIEVEDVETDDALEPSRPPAWQSRAPNRLRRIIRSALLWVVIPTLIAGVYYGSIATDQYASRAQFSVRSQALSSASSPGAIAAGTFAIAGDLAIVNQYITSLQILKDIEPYLNVRAIYSNPSADWLARLDPNVPDEKLINYWRSMVEVHFDPTTGLAELQVRAFTAEDAKAVADRVLWLSESLVNRMSERSRSDAVKLSQQEVEKAREHVIKSIDAIQEYSAKAKSINPLAAAETEAGIQGRLKDEVLKLQADLSVLRQSLPEDAPGVVRLKGRISVMESQLAEQKTTATSSSNGTAPGQVLSGFDKLRLEQTFAQQAYEAALTANETARLEAVRQSKYLEAFVRPQLASYAEYPERLNNVLLTLLCATLIWAIGGFLVAATMEHL